MYPSFAERPGIPGEPLIEEQVSRSVHLHWSMSSQQTTGDQNLPDSYSVYGAQHGLDSWKLLASSIHSNSHIVENLNPDTTYVFRVTAHNAIGEGPPGMSSQPVSIPTEEGKNIDVDMAL